MWNGSTDAPEMHSNCGGESSLSSLPRSTATRDESQPRDALPPEVSPKFHPDQFSYGDTLYSNSASEDPFLAMFCRQEEDLDSFTEKTDGDRGGGSWKAFTDWDTPPTSKPCGKRPRNNDGSAETPEAREPQPKQPCLLADQLNGLNGRQAWLLLKSDSQDLPLSSHSSTPTPQSPVPSQYVNSVVDNTDAIEDLPFYGVNADDLGENKYLEDLTFQDALLQVFDEPDLSDPHDLLFQYRLLQNQYRELEARCQELERRNKILEADNNLWIEQQQRRTTPRPPLPAPAEPLVDEGIYLSMASRVDDTSSLAGARPVARAPRISTLPYRFPPSTMSPPLAPGVPLRPSPSTLPTNPAPSFTPPAPAPSATEYWCSEEGRLFLGGTLQQDFRGSEYLYRAIGHSIEKGDRFHNNFILDAHPHCKVDEATKRGRIYIILNTTGRMKFTPSQGSETAGWRANSKSYHAPQYEWEKKRSTFAVHKTPKRACLVVIQRNTPQGQATPGPEYFLYHFWIKAV